MDAFELSRLLPFVEYLVWFINQTRPFVLKVSSSRSKYFVIIAGSVATAWHMIVAQLAGVLLQGVSP